LIIEAIFLQENSLQAPKVRSWVGGWAGCLAFGRELLHPDGIVKLINGSGRQLDR
jgi:hypothetical protein